jgi:DNA polymerase-4
MDAFYASVELRQRPELKGKPIAVGGGSRRGVLTTCNYEARKFGCRSAMPGWQARELCPQLTFLPVRFELYKTEALEIRKIMARYAELIEPLSLDEAFLDVSSSERFAWDIAKELRARIREERGLTASAGIAPNKLLAKIASDWRKPDGQFAVTPDQVLDFMRELPVRKLWGVGPKSEERFHKMGIRTCGDLQQLSREELEERFGLSHGEELHRLCRGEDDRPVRTFRLRKSLSTETTLRRNLASIQEGRLKVHRLAGELANDLAARAKGREPAKAFVKVKFSDFTHTTKECVCSKPDAEVFVKLFEEAAVRKKLPIRLIGVGVRFTEGDDEEEERGSDVPEQLVFYFLEGAPLSR